MLPGQRSKYRWECRQGVLVTLVDKNMAAAARRWDLVPPESKTAERYVVCDGGERFGVMQGRHYHVPVFWSPNVFARCSHEAFLALPTLPELFP